MKCLSKVLLVLTALHIALPVHAVGARQNPIPVSNSWTPTQVCLAGAVAGLAVCGLFYVYNRWINPVRQEPFTLQPIVLANVFDIRPSIGTSVHNYFDQLSNNIVTQIDAAMPRDIQFIISGEFRGVTCGCSKGRYNTGQEAYIVRLQRGSNFVDLSCSSITSLSAQVKSSLEGMFNVAVVNQADIETFLRNQFN